MNTHLRDNLLQTAPAKVTTAGDIVYATGANALARLGIGAEGKALVVVSGVPAWGLPYVVIVKAANGTPVNSSTTVISDADLVWPIAANERWTFRLAIPVVSNATANFRTTFTIPSGAAGSAFGSDGAFTTPSTSGSLVGGRDDMTTEQVWEMSSTSLWLILYGFVLNGANAGSVTFRYAQGTSTAVDTYPKAGASLLAFRA